MVQGRHLEKIIRKVEKKIYKLCGVQTSHKCPVKGASPDGVSEDYMIEMNLKNR